MEASLKLKENDGGMIGNKAQHHGKVLMEGGQKYKQKSNVSCNDIQSQNIV